MCQSWYCYLIMKGWGGVEDLRYQRQWYLFNFLVTAASGLNLFFLSTQDITTFNILLSFFIDVSTIKLCTVGNCSMAWVKQIFFQALP